MGEDIGRRILDAIRSYKTMPIEKLQEERRKLCIDYNRQIEVLEEGGVVDRGAPREDPGFTIRDKDELLKDLGRIYGKLIAVMVLPGADSDEGILVGGER